MKIVYFGSGRFGLPALEALKRSEHEILGVVTAADKPIGRHLKTRPSVVKDWAQKNDVPVLPFDRVRTDESLALLQALQADVFVVIAYGHLLSKRVLSLPKICPLNVHASLLPRHRGAAPIHRAILEGDRLTGVCVMRMVEKLDAGDVLRQKTVSVRPEDDFVSMELKLSQAGAEALLEALRSLEDGTAVFTPQDESLVTYAAKVSKEEAAIDWSLPAERVVRAVRAFKVWPVCHTAHAGKRLLVHEAEVLLGPAPAGSSPGTVIASGQQGFIVAAGGGSAVSLTKVQAEGKKALPAAEFLRGHAVAAGDRLGPH